MHGNVAGLKLTLNVDVAEYIPYLYQGAGARILVRDQYTMPFVDTDGVSLSPGTEKTIGVKKVCHKRKL